MCSAQSSGLTALPQEVQFRQNLAVTVPAGRKFYSANVRRGCIHRQTHIAPLVPALDTVLCGLPPTVAEKLDASAVDQEIQRPIGAPIADLDNQGLFSAGTGSNKTARPSPSPPSSAGWPPSRRSAAMAV